MSSVFVARAEVGGRPSRKWLLVLGTPLALAAGSGCAPASEGDRPRASLTAADRTPDPSCTASWVAAMTAHVVDEDGRAVAGARVAPCIVTGEGIGSCLAPTTTDARGWALWEVEPSLRCLSRITLRIAAADTSGHAASYQRLALRPVDAVLDVADDLVLVSTAPALSREPLGDATASHTIRFAGDVELALRPDATGDPDDYARAGLVAVAGADAPDFMQTDGAPELVFAFSPDAELLEPATLSLPAPGGARDGTVFEVRVLGGLYTSLADGSLVEEGALGTFARASVDEGRLVVSGLPRLGWISFTRAR